jgi:hypothetical protein
MRVILGDFLDTNHQELPGASQGLVCYPVLKIYLKLNFNISVKGALGLDKNTQGRFWM